MKRRLGFGGEPEEPADGEDAAPPRQQTSQRAVPVLRSAQAGAGLALAWKSNTHLFQGKARKTALQQPQPLLLGWRLLAGTRSSFKSPGPPMEQPSSPPAPSATPVAGGRCGGKGGAGTRMHGRRLQGAGMSSVENSVSDNEGSSMLLASHLRVY